MHDHRDDRRRPHRNARLENRRGIRRSNVVERRASDSSLSVARVSFGPLPADPSNRVADDSSAAALGHRLFFDTRLSGNGKVSCATCHLAEQQFQDGVALARASERPRRRTMPIAGTALGPWLFWDGRTDSQWAQALGPLESAVEHGGTRTQYAQVVASHYRDEYDERVRSTALPRWVARVTPDPWPIRRGARRGQRIPATRQEDISRVYANIGKAIAAFERRIGFVPTRFDRYVDALLAGRTHDSSSTLDADEVAGLRLFIGKANCVNCHNGARLTDDHFHNTGVPVSTAALPADSGRSVGVRQALAGEFNCMSRYSDAKPDDCAELRFATTEGEELVRAYKTPSLRGVAERAPYMHAGQHATLSDVIAHYDRAPRAPMGHSELKPLRLTLKERNQIEAFLRTLSAPAAAPSARQYPVREAPAAGGLR